MIGRSFRRAKAAEGVEAKGFDAFHLRLGDLMRGERATMGKSLLDVQRELKIKAAYIAAIENADPTAFDTPGFIAGYVRSYARYLNMDPDWAFDTFCRESGFATAHGMSAEASSVKPTREERLAATGLGKDIFASSATPFIPASDRFFSGIEPRAIGSIMVLVTLISVLGYGGWTVLQEVQKVQFAPIDQAPTVVAEVDPLAGATRADTSADSDLTAFQAPSPEALDRLYRPQALDVPVLVARDGPIVTLAPVAPANVSPNAVENAVLAAVGPGGIGPVQSDPLAMGPAVQVTADPIPGVQLVAVRPAWVRVRAADGSVIYEGILLRSASKQRYQPRSCRASVLAALWHPNRSRWSRGAGRAPARQALARRGSESRAPAPLSQVRLQPQDGSRRVSAEPERPRSHRGPLHRTRPRPDASAHRTPSGIGRNGRDPNAWRVATRWSEKRSCRSGSGRRVGRRSSGSESAALTSTACMAQQ